MIGQRVGNYRITRPLGRGGMGEVYEAIHVQLRRRVAIKFLHPQFTQHPHVAARFFNEALAVNLVQHQGLVSIYEHGQQPDGAAYIVMEYLEGESLGQRLQRRSPLPQAEARRICRQIASVLAVTHDQRIVHRDLKPANVMLVRDSETTGGERGQGP